MQTPCVEVRGARIPALGFGTWQLEGDVCTEAVRHALELGYRHIDTARMYANERAVGKGLRDSGVDRDEVFVVTKLWTDEMRADQVAKCVPDSLRRLGLDHLDMLLIHWPSSDVPLAETLDAMRAQQEKGRVRFLGVSNFPPGLLKEALDLADIVCNQVEYHPYLAQDELLAMAREHELTLTAYSPLARGRVHRDMTLRRIADRHGVTPAEVVLRWLIQQPYVSVIPRSADPAHRQANLAALRIRLDADEMRRISALGRDQRLIDPEFAPDWTS
ncbi:MAG TPA: aldo/keto reductase [Actinomycetota bacterium]|nr:aldo/keto reductase [Actinomycetota bacterium]